MKYIIKETIDGREKLTYTNEYDKLEQSYFELYLEEQNIDDIDEYEEGGDIDTLWDEFFESEIYKEFHEQIDEGPNVKTEIER